MAQTATVYFSVNDPLPIPHFSIEERECTIMVLAFKYPKCFFVDPKQRIPIKHHILDDIRLDGLLTELKGDEYTRAELLLCDSVGYYKGNIEYARSLQAGAYRVDLRGFYVGPSVSALEALIARRHVQYCEAVVARKVEGARIKAQQEADRIAREAEKARLKAEGYGKAECIDCGNTFAKLNPTSNRCGCVGRKASRKFRAKARDRGIDATGLTIVQIQAALALKKVA